jgi:MT-A70
MLRHPSADQAAKALGSLRTSGVYAMDRPHGVSMLIAPVRFPIGCGYWTRANPEQCLLATRGHPSRRSRGVRKLVVAPRREHSRKPDEIYERIEALCDGPYLEMFARHSRPGWAAWGTEVGILDSGTELKRRWRSNSHPDEACK